MPKFTSQAAPVAGDGAGGKPSASLAPPGVSVVAADALNDDIYVLAFDVTPLEPLTLGQAEVPAVKVGWVEQGSARVQQGGTAVNLAPNQLIVSPAGAAVGMHMKQERFVGIKLAVQILEEAVTRRADPGRTLVGQALSIPDSLRPLQLCRVLYNEAMRPAEQRDSLFIAAVVDALALCLVPTSDARSARQDPRIRRAIEFMNRHSDQPLNLSTIAQEAGITRYHFSRLFKAEIGTSPYQYLLDRRLDAAARLLKATTETVTEVALEVGFTGLSRFSHMFRRRFGFPPTALRKR